MSFIFGAKSRAMLSQVHPKLKELAEVALATGIQDFSIICGHRGYAAQEAAYKAGNTKVHFPNSAHNQVPSCAIDVLPYPFTNWNDPAMLEGWKQINDAFMIASQKTGTPYRWGGDFNRDGDRTKSDSWDKPHFELHPWRNFA
jgi:peptidoglycan L-alanyl-D-glutamate endopeptidase CwlK